MPFCKFHLGDRPIPVTFKRAIAALSLWQKARLAWGLCFLSDPIRYKFMFFLFFSSGNCCIIRHHSLTLKERRFSSICLVRKQVRMLGLGPNHVVLDGRPQPEPFLLTSDVASFQNRNHSRVVMCVCTGELADNFT